MKKTINSLTFIVLGFLISFSSFANQDNNNELSITYNNLIKQLIAYISEPQTQTEVFQLGGDGKWPDGGDIDLKAGSSCNANSCSND